MSSLDPHTSPGTAGASSAAQVGTRAGSAASFLHAHDADTRHDSRHVLIGIVVFLLLGVVALNIAIYRHSASALQHEGWRRLEESTDLRRDQLGRAIQSLAAAAVETAADPIVRRNVRQLLDHGGTAQVHAALDDELRSRRELLSLENLQVVDVDGHVLYELGPTTNAESRRIRALCRLADGTRRCQVGDPMGSEILIAVPIRTQGAAPSANIVLHAIEPDLLSQLLGHWPGLGELSGAFLVRDVGTQAMVLTDFDPDGLRAGNRAPLSARAALPLSMAATGVESDVRFEDASGRPVWVVTRTLPGLGWGLVAQADGAEMMAPLGATRQGLLLLDFGLALVLLGMGWVWRRLYISGLAQREMEITERHARRVQAIFDNAFDAIFTFDRGGRVRTVNRAAAKLFGRTPDEMDGRTMRQFLSWGTGTGTTSLPPSGTVGTGEALRPDGVHVPVEFSLGSTGSGDELIYTAIVRDTSERVEAEQRIRSFAEGLEISNRRLEEVNAQLEEASRLKSEFLANTSHELRTPLNGMIGFLQLVLDGMCDSQDEERDFLRQALQCSRHLLGLINDVLDIAKIEAGKLALEVERIDVQQLFDEAFTLTHVQSAQRGIQLHIDAQIEDGVFARGDFGKVKQVLVNLIGNSIKFTPRGSVTVRAVSHADLGHILFEVVDTGIGIPADRQKVIFEKFVQGDGSTTRRFGGTGLGLAISRSLVELMGGIIGVHSDGEGRGTRMYFSLPVWRDAPVADPGQTPANDCIQGPAGGALVLIVEDDPVFRHFLTHVLQQNGFRTAEADHAEAGWVLARRLQPACVVLDYALACSDGAVLRSGWDLAERLTSEDETRRIPIVFVTGFDSELKDKLRSTVFSRRPERLVKPIEASDLLDRVHKLVGEKATVVRILMADDDPTVAAYVRKVLPPSRFHVEVANNGEECLHALRMQPNGFDLLMLDLMMPEVSGYDVLREITLTGIRPDLPVLVLTNFPEPRTDEERRLLDQGLVLDVVSKTAVHDNPQLLPHVLDWHLAVSRQDAGEAESGREAA